MANGKKFTFNWPFFGNQHIIDFLQSSIASRQVAHFYIFSGGENLGKTTVARYFAASLLCRNFTQTSGDLPCGECESCTQIARGIHSDLVVIKKASDKKKYRH